MSQTTADQLLELLLTLKKTTPESAKTILNAQPQIAYATIALMVSMNAINIDVFQKVLADYAQSQPAAAPPAAPAIPPHMQHHTVQPAYRTPTPPQMSYQSTPPVAYQPPYQQPVRNHSPYQQPPQPHPSLAHFPEDQRTLIMQVLQMTPEQINMLPPAERAGIMQLKQQLGRGL